MLRYLVAGRRIRASIILSVAAVAAAPLSGSTADQPAPPASGQPPAVEQATTKSPPASKDAAAKMTAETEAERAKLRLREGTRLRDITGRFRQNGDTLTFIDEQKREIGGLPNLNLERIIRMLKTVEEPESITWSVSGTITEFSGRNYLLISRAVYKAATPPPSPEALAK
jgi:hypothetical protein